MLSGRFTLLDKFGNPQSVVQNTVVDEGQEAFAGMLMRGLTTPVAAGADFFLGLCGASVDQADTLADVLGELSSAGGYAREAISRDATGFPTISKVNGVYRALSKVVTFTASGANFSATFRRCFLCSVSSGTSGALFSYSGPFPAIQINDGESQQITWELFFNW
jgi:hypothetical protein